MAFGNLEAGIRSCQEKSKVARADEWETTGLYMEKAAHLLNKAKGPCFLWPPCGPCRRNVIWLFLFFIIFKVSLFI